MSYPFYRAVRPCVFSVFTSLLTATIFSNSSYAYDKPLAVMPQLIVSATRIPTAANEVASSVSIITSDDIEARQQRTLSEVLQDVAGLNLVQTGSAGGATSVFMRGTNANHTKVFIDGIDVSDPSTSNGSFDFSQLLASDIERVEVLRGAQSGLYGSDAIGGVINIITKKGSGKPQFISSVEGGSFSTFNQSVGVSGSQERFNYNFNVEHFHTGSTPVTPANLVVAGRPRNDDSYDNKTVSSKLGFNLTDNFDVGLVTRYTTTALESTSDDFTGPEAISSQSDNRELFTRGTAHLASFDGTLNNTIGLAYTDYRRRYLDPNNTPAIPSFYNGNRYKLDWQGDVKIAEGQTLTLGTEHQHDAIDNMAGAEVNNDAGYIQLQSSFGKRFFNSISLRHDENEKFGGKETYRIAPAFLITETDTKLKASLGSGFKAPSLDQLFHDYPAFGFFANPNLQPETSTGYDLGFEQNLFNNRVQFGSTWFHNDIKNLITYNNSFTSYANVGKATTYGFENFIAYKPINTLNLRADYTFTIAENALLDQELLRRPKNKASLNATWQANDKTSISATLLYTGAWIDGNRDFSISRLKAGSYTTVNLAASYDLNDKVALFGRINNLFDQRYENPIGFEGQGIGVFAGIKGKF